MFQNFSEQYPFLAQLPTFFQNHPLLSIAWVGLLVLVIVLTIQAKFSKIVDLTRAQVIQALNNDDAIIVDLRSNSDFRTGHIANSINLLPAEIKKGSLGKLDKYKDQLIIVTCATGMTSRASASELYKKQGFMRVATLKEGIAGWNGENLPLVKGK
ncbi:rhodanese-like domain-containing protein [Thorsellia kenyensis]|uniref:Rhodanese-like domain-containing protein n=1 Tax=Thorsellia kenyensis TaxID=1549888 RepID=A0ABV6C9B5_9GAMM